MEKKWFNKTVEEVEKDLSTNIDNGLSQDEINKR